MDRLAHFFSPFTHLLFTSRQPRSDVKVEGLIFLLGIKRHIGINFSVF